MGPFPKKRQDDGEERHRKQSLPCKCERHDTLSETSSRTDLVTIFGDREGSQEVTS